MKFEKVEPERLSDAVFRQLHKMIANGDLSAGQRLPPERELADQFGVSRASLREALHLLDHAGLVRKRQGAGVFVVEDTWKASTPFYWLPWAIEHHKELLGLLEAREGIETETARLAALRMDEKRGWALSRLHEEFSVAVSDEDFDKALKLDWRFHGQIGDAAGNEFLSGLVRTVHKIINDAVRGMYSLEPNVPRSAVDEHAAILDKILAGDSDGASDVMRAHISDIRSTLAETIERSTQSSEDGIVGGVE